MYNCATLIGNLGKDPEIRNSADGKPIANFSVATSEKRKDKTYTEWHNCVCFGKLAEKARDYLHKGNRVFIVGQIRTNKWTDKDGQERKTTQIIVDTLRNLSYRKEESDAAEPEAPPPPSDEDAPF